MVFHENCLLADNSHKISFLICKFEKQQTLKLSSAANYRWRFMDLILFPPVMTFVLKFLGSQHCKQYGPLSEQSVQGS